MVIKLKRLMISNDINFFIESFYDNLLNKTYIITGNNNYVKSYDYGINKLYNKYYDINNGMHLNVIIIKYDILKLIESFEDGNIRTWNFHSGLLLIKINCESSLLSICVWNKNYLLLDARMVKLNYWIYMKILLLGI